MTTPPPNSRAAINTCVPSLLSPHSEELDRLHNRLYIGTIQSALLSSRPDWRADDKSAVEVYTAVIATKKITLSPTFLNQDLPQLYRLLEYLTIPAIQRPPSHSKLPRSLHHASAHFWSWPWSGMCWQSKNRISRKQPSTENKSKRSRDQLKSASESIVRPDRLS